MRAIDEWLGRHRRLLLAAIVTCSIAVRVVYFVELRGGPLLHEHLWPQWDMEFFDRQARSLASGDWLASRPLHPFHSWHADVAAAYLRGHPGEPLSDRFAAAVDEGEREAAERELWDHWYGGVRYHQEPLYAYGVALVYRLLGPDVRWVFAAQLLLGVGSNVLVLLLARRAFGDLVGAVAGALAVLCSPALYYEMILLRTAPLGFLSLAIGYVTCLALARRSPRFWAAAGVLAGVGLLLQSLLVVLLAGAAAILAFDRWKDPRCLLREGAAFLAGASLPLVPLVVRNLLVGAPALSLTSIGAVTFVCSNASDVRPDVGFMVSRFTALVMGDSGGKFVPAVLATLRTHAGVSGYLTLLLGKLAALSHWYEIPNNTNFYFYRLHAPILRWLPVTFTLAGPLGALGMALAAREARRARVLYLLVAVGVAPMLVFYVLSRFRAPLLLALLPFAALALVRCGSWLAARRFVPGLTSLAGALVLLAWTSRPLPEGRPLIRIQDHSVTYEVHYSALAREAEERGDPAGAARVLLDFLRFEPDRMRSMSPLDPPASGSEASFARWYAAVHARLAEDLAASGDAEGAARERGRAETLLASRSATPR